jgi:DNA-directed RNA polymerase subunit E'/Rpb7
MDPLFERRELKKKVHIHARFLQKNIEASILSQLKQKYENKCLTEGFVQQNSITIVKYGLGRANYLAGGIDYEVAFQADICMPHVGQKFKAPVKLRSKIGIHAETPPVKILIPRDLHLGSEDFEAVKVDDEIEFEVVGSQFKQEDDSIVVVGRLLSKVAPPVEAPMLVGRPVEQETASGNPVPKSDSGEEKMVTFSPVEQPKKRRLRRTEGGNTNEQYGSLKEGMAEGTA